MAAREPYDAVVVGSGAGGGMAAWVLASKGLHVLMLEAGRHYDPYEETSMFGAARCKLRAVAAPQCVTGPAPDTPDFGCTMNTCAIFTSSAVEIAVLAPVCGSG